MNEASEATEKATKTGKKTEKKQERVNPFPTYKKG